MSTALDDLFEGLQLRPATKHLVEHLLADRPLMPASIVDFGVDSPEHYRALKAVLLSESDFSETELEAGRALEGLRKRILELEAALGNGSRLNALVKRYAPEYVGRVQFQTDWDVLLGRLEDRSNSEG
jgi:hypothetical protein